MDNRMPKKKMKINSNIKALKSGVWYTIGNFIVKAMGFISMPIFTRIMSPEAVGDFSNFTSWVAILGAIATADLYSSVWMARFDYRDELNDYIASNLVLGSTITICFYAIALLFKRFFLKLFCFSELELHTAFVYFMVYPALQMFQVKSRIEYKYKTSVMLSISSALISTGVSLICVILTEHKLIGRLMGYYVPLIFLNGALYIYMLKRSNKISCQYWRYGLTISLPMVLHTLSGSLLGSSDRVMIKHMCGSSATAFYSIAYSCAMIVSVLWMSLNSAWSPWAYEKMNEKDFIMLKRASKPYILFFGFVVFCFLLVSPEVLWLMGGETYKGALAVIPPVMVAYVFQFVYSLYVNIEIFSKKQHYIAIGTTVAAGINIALNYIFIPIFGYVAAAYTTLVGYIMLYLVHFAFVVKIKKSNWYDTRFNFSFLLIFIGIMILSHFLYRLTEFRYTIIAMLVGAIVLLCFVCRKELIYLFKNKSFCELSMRLKAIYMRINKGKKH